MSTAPRQILLLMDDVEAEFFTQHLTPHAGDASLHQARSLQDVEQRLSSKITTRILSFCSSIIVPSRILERIGYNAFNFHPGPPERPGFRPAYFAARDGARMFGVTFHQMTAQVDAGAIIEAIRFELAGTEDPQTIDAQSYRTLAALVRRRAPDLANVDFVFGTSGDVWSGSKTTHKEFELLGRTTGNLPTTS